MEKIKKNFPIICIFFLAFILRAYNLGEIPGPAFDEVFYPLWGLSYLTGEQFFAVHPPLGNYLFTFSIYMFHLLPGTEELSVIGHSVDQLNPLSYRWLNAIAGSFLVIVAYFSALRIYNKTTFAFLVALFFAIDGSMLVDSRFGLINIYLTFFGSISILLFLQSVQKNDHKFLNMVLCGVFLGLTVSIKWNGLGYWLAIIMFSFLLYLLKIADSNENKLEIETKDIQILNKKFSPNTNFFLSIFFVPLIIYLLIWLPDLAFNADFDVVDKHKQLSSFHSNSLEGKLHPYSSPWYSWPFMGRTVGYYFSSVDILAGDGIKKTMFTDVHLFPNPVIYWFSAASILILSFQWIYSLQKFYFNQTYDKQFLSISFILIGFYVNFLP